MAILFGSKGLGDFPTFIKAGESQSCPFTVSVNSTTGAIVIGYGLVNGVIPSGLTGLNVAETGTFFLVLTVTLGSGAVTGAVFSVESSIPNVYSATQGSPPLQVKITTHAIVDRSVKKIIGCNNISLNAIELFRTDKPDPTVIGITPYNSWYGYEIIS
jgi:hypothetical protein